MGFKGKLTRRHTKAERVLIDALCRNKILFTFQGVFLDQKHGYIVDFLIRSDGRNPLVVEVDGSSHASQKAQAYDWKRTDWLKKKRNCRVLRVTNDEVETQVDQVIVKIRRMICEQVPAKRDEPLRKAMQDNDELDAEFRRMVSL